MAQTNNWNADVYDQKFNYVSHYGQGIMELLKPQKGERILDLGCGTGDLTSEIARLGADVVGMDASQEMITTALEKYPSISFVVADGETFLTEEKFHAVFSNAALHWMKNAEKVVQSIERALLPKGRFVAEFGGKGNIDAIIQGITNVLQEEYAINVSSRNPWYFPSVGEYSSLLEKYGFEVSYAHLFDRPTKLPDGDEGLFRFLDTFAMNFFPELSQGEKADAYNKIKALVKDQLFKEGVWEADYRRLQIIAIKK